ncbi:MAG: arsenate reductase ArsC [Prevotella sp.]|nr:arsenate reductase ArsC [Prevotella sp.]
MTKVLFLCTGNSCRSQMAEACLQAIDPALTVRSAGTDPCEAVNPYAVRAMGEVGIDIAGRIPQSVETCTGEPWDYVITVCDHARGTCPHFTGIVAHRLHIGFADPAEATGSDEDIMRVFRTVRAEIREAMNRFYHEYIHQ